MSEIVTEPPDFAKCMAKFMKLKIDWASSLLNPVIPSILLFEDEIKDNVKYKTYTNIN